MNGEFAIFMLSNVVRPANKRNARSSGRLFSGAAIGASALVIATVEAVGPRQFRLAADKSEIFVLEGRDQRSSRRHHASVQAFVREQKLTYLLLRGSPANGKQVAAPATYLIEGMSKLIAGLHVEIVPHQSLSKWVRREGTRAPYVPLGVSRQLHAIYELAIQTACLSEAQNRDPEYAIGETGGSS